MFNMASDAAADVKDSRLPSEAPRLAPALGPTTQHREMSDLFARLQKNIEKMRWTSSTDEELDRKEIESCDTDSQPLEWTMKGV